MALFRTRGRSSTVTGRPKRYGSATINTNVGYNAAGGNTLFPYSYFGGGFISNTNTIIDKVFVFDLLTQTTNASDMSVTRYNLAAASNDEYVLFAGGETSTVTVTASDVVEAYEIETGTKTVLTSLTEPKWGLVGIAFKDSSYFLFGGGMGSNSTNTQYIEVYDDQLTKQSNISLYSSGNYRLSNGMTVARVGGDVTERVVFRGQEFKSTSQSYDNFERYYCINNTLTTTQLQYSTPYIWQAYGGATTVIKDDSTQYMLFLGGYGEDEQVQTSMWFSSGRVIDNTLTTISTTDIKLSTPRRNSEGIEFGNYCAFVNGQGNDINGSCIMDIFDKYLTRNQSAPSHSSNDSIHAKVHDSTKNMDLCLISYINGIHSDAYIDVFYN